MNWKQKQIKQFTLSTIVFIAFIAGTATAKAGDRAGNGGSGDETAIVAGQAQLESVALKIKHFFIKNEERLETEFPEFDIKDLVYVSENAGLEVVSKGELIDKHGESRACLNFPSALHIECDRDKLEETAKDPKALFVLVFHEMLGLLGVEETSPLHNDKSDGYKISKRLAPYVTRVSDYDLSISAKADVAPQACTFSLMDRKTGLSLFEEQTTPARVFSKEKVIENVNELKKIKRIMQNKGYREVAKKDAYFRLEFAAYGASFWTSATRAANVGVWGAIKQELSHSALVEFNTYNFLPKDRFVLQGRSALGVGRAKSKLFDELEGTIKDCRSK